MSSFAPLRTTPAETEAGGVPPAEAGVAAPTDPERGRRRGREAQRVVRSHTTLRKHPRALAHSPKKDPWNVKVNAAFSRRGARENAAHTPKNGTAASAVHDRGHSQVRSDFLALHPTNHPRAALPRRRPIQVTNPVQRGRLRPHPARARAIERS